MTRRSGLRVGLTLADQVIASGTNLALTVLVARSVSPRDFGIFSTLLACYVLSLALVRGMTSDPLVTRYSAAPTPEVRAATRGSSAATIVMAVGLSVCAVAVVPVLSGSLRSSTLAFAVVLPGVLLQDHLRFVFFAEGRPAQALVNDVLWAVAQVAGIIAVTAQGDAPVAVLVLVWGAAGTLAGVVALLQGRIGPSFRRVGWWLREHRDLWRYYVLDNSVMQATNLIVLVVVGAAANLAAAGSIRAAVAVFGPLTILSLGARAGAVPELARLAARNLSVMRLYALLMGVALALATAAWGMGALLLPLGAGRSLFGDTWILARPILVFTAIDATAALFVVGPYAGMRALGAGRLGLHARTGLRAVRLWVASTGALLGGAHGAALGFALVAPVQMGVCWWQFQRAYAAAGSPQPESSTAPESVGPG